MFKRVVFITGLNMFFSISCFAIDENETKNTQDEIEEEIVAEDDEQQKTDKEDQKQKMIDIKLQNAIARKERSLEEFTRLLQEEGKKTTDARKEEVTILIKDVQMAGTILSTLKRGKNMSRKSVMKEVQHFNENMKRIEESYKKLVQMNQFDTDSEEQIDHTGVLLSPTSEANNAQSIDGLNWHRKVRFDEIFNPLSIGEEPVISKREELPIKALPESVISSSTPSSSDSFSTRNPDDILTK